jgi:hypothetical protein
MGNFKWYALHAHETPFYPSFNYEQHKVMVYGLANFHTFGQTFVLFEF